MARTQLAVVLLLAALCSAHASRSLRQAGSPAIAVHCGDGDVAIRNQIGQTFVAPASDSVTKIAIWMRPNLYYVTTYRLELYSGEFASGGVKLAEAALGLEPSESASGAPAKFHVFEFSGVTLVEGNTYSWLLMRTSQYSGDFAPCTDVIQGRGFWLGVHPEPDNIDYSFELWTAPAPVPTTTPPPPAPAPEAPGGLLFTIKSAVDDRCLIMGDNGNAAYPGRHNWAAGDFCGFPEQNGLSAKDSLIANKQAVWRLEKLDGNLYTIKSTVDERCLIFGGNGNDAYPSRYDWGAGGKFCGFPELNGMSSKESLLENKQAVWELENLDGNRFIIKSAVAGRCLIFGGNGNDAYPSRYDWGAGGEFCGFPELNGMSSKESLLDNKQAVYHLQLLA
mmetsp:Transcript_47739/g.121804  ORF Transcript_47739/g.121804 Transcript_47739/m.121804 type:complete len:392 (-) Transcript_47739:218-1393(-)|eukprot:jgi/Tetstr1/426063/TSEL_016394.t1